MLGLSVVLWRKYTSGSTSEKEPFVVGLSVVLWRKCTSGSASEKEPFVLGLSVVLCKNSLFESATERLISPAEASNVVPASKNSASAVEVKMRFIIKPRKSKR